MENQLIGNQLGKGEKMNNRIISANRIDYVCINLRTHEIGFQRWHKALEEDSLRWYKLTPKREQIAQGLVFSRCEIFIDIYLATVFLYWKKNEQ